MRYVRGLLRKHAAQTRIASYSIQPRSTSSAVKGQFSFDRRSSAAGSPLIRCSTLVRQVALPIPPWQTSSRSGCANLVPQAWGGGKGSRTSPSGPKLSPRLHEKCIFYQNRCLATAPIIFLFLGRPRQIRAVAKMPWRLRESFIFLENARFTTVPLIFSLRQQRLPDGLRRVSRRYC